MRLARGLSKRRAAFTVYGWDPDIGDEELLEKLLALNLEPAEEERRRVNQRRRSKGSAV